MNKDKIIVDIFNSDLINKFLTSVISKSKYSMSDRSELKSELVMQLYKTKEEKLIEWKKRNVLEYVCITIMKRIVMGTNVNKDTIFYCKNREYSYDNNDIIKPVIEEFNHHNKLEDIETQIEKLHWYNKVLFKLYYIEGYNLREIAELTDINLKSIHYSITKSREEIKNNLRKND